jgi:hypothetical protein
VRGWREWAEPFVWIGLNPIAIYLVHNMIPLPWISSRLLGGPIAAFLGNFGELLLAATVLAMTLVLARFLYQKRLCLRL